jgi:hypothetical protein
MAIRLSTGLASALLGSNSFKTIFQNGFIGIFSGGQPPDANQAETGSLLCVISKASGTAGVIWGTAGAGQLPNSADVWSGLCGTAGVAGWFRLYDSNFTMGSSGTANRIDGNIGVSGSDLVLANTNMVVGATQTIISAIVTEPQA